MPRPTPLPVVPSADPIQLVLGLPVGIVRPRRRKGMWGGKHPWMRARRAA